MELLFLLIPVAVIGVAIVAFKRFWPSAPDEKSATSTSLLTGPPRQLTTGQIARGVFWGMWLFWLSQIIITGIILFAVLLLGGAMMRSVVPAGF